VAWIPGSQANTRLLGMPTGYMRPPICAAALREVCRFSHRRSRARQRPTLVGPALGAGGGVRKMVDPDGILGRSGNSGEPRPRAKFSDPRRNRCSVWNVARGNSLRAPFDGGSHQDRVDRTEEAPSVNKVWDPWAEDEPVFGNRERRHALSRHPGTPPCGNLAVQDPTGAGEADAAPSLPGSEDKTVGEDGGEPRLPKELVVLVRPLRIEIELGSSGRWVCGLVERASRTGLEAKLEEWPVRNRSLIPSRLQVKMLVTPHGESSFVLRARVLWIDPSASPGEPTGTQLALVTTDPAVLARWLKAVASARV